LAVKGFLRKTGPNYRNKSNRVHLDEILGSDRWGQIKTPRPRLATDHLVSLREISEMSEITDVLKIYEKAPRDVQRDIVNELVDIGDIQENLVRMRKDANEFKSDKSWHDIITSDVEKFGYKFDDIKKMRDKYDSVKPIIRKRIRDISAKYQKYQ
jgi:hypothetical protein